MYTHTDTPAKWRRGRCGCSQDYLESYSAGKSWKQFWKRKKNRSVWGKLFLTDGPAEGNDFSPNVFVYMMGDKCTGVECGSQLSGWRRWCVRDGTEARYYMKFWDSVLNIIHYLYQCRIWRIGWMWSDFLAFTIYMKPCCCILNFLKFV